MTSYLFSFGQIAFTPGSIDAMNELNVDPRRLLKRHGTGDWGDLCAEDKKLNDQSVYGEGRIFSAYQLDKETKIWVITESDRSATTFLLPSEY